MSRKCNKEDLKCIFKYLAPTLIFLTIGLMMLTSCRSTKEIPVQTIEKIVYHDSLIYIKDTLTVEIPKEVVKEVVLQMDTSYLKTSLAESIAYVDTAEKKLYHTLTQKGEIKTQYDTVIKIQYVDRIVTKDVPVKIEVVKYKRDTFYWVLLGWAVLCVAFVLLKKLLK